jgi:hypothetical protein
MLQQEICGKYYATIILSSRKGLTVEETIAELYSDPFPYKSDTEWNGLVSEKKCNENKSM